MRRAMLLFSAGFVAVALAAIAQAGKHNHKLDIGDKAPAIAALPAADGKTYSSGDFKDDDALVVVFTCNHCPVAQAYVGRMNAFAADYGGKKIGLVAVSVSDDPSDGLAAMKTFAERQGLKFPYVRDESQASGKAFGASVTPHVFVLDRDRKVAYMGAWDDNWANPDKVARRYVRDAVDALLAGKTPAVAETQQVGCGISYR